MKTSIVAVLTLAILALTSGPGHAQVPYSGGPTIPAAGYYAPQPPPPAPIVPGMANSLPPPPAPMPPVQPMPPSAPIMPAPASIAPLPSRADPLAPAVSCQDDAGSIGYWSAGGGIYFMTPYYTSNPAFYTGNGAGTNFGVTDFHQHMTVSPLAWIGFTWDNGWGIRGRWFQFDGTGQAGFVADANTAVIGIPTNGLMGLTPGSLVTATNNLQLSVYDLEATCNWVFGRWSILGSAGVRYAHYSQSYQISIADPINGFTSASSGNNFSGAGPTLGVELCRQMFDGIPFVSRFASDGSRFCLYASARGSLLYGASHQDADLPTVFVIDPSFTASQATVVPVGELEVGGEWARICGRLRFFVQAAFIGQAWLGGNNGSLGISEYNFGTGVLSNFGFVGGVVRAGINF